MKPPHSGRPPSAGSSGGEGRRNPPHRDGNRDQNRDPGRPGRREFFSGGQRNDGPRPDRPHPDRPRQDQPRQDRSDRPARQDQPRQDRPRFGSGPQRNESQGPRHHQGDRRPQRDHAGPRPSPETPKGAIWLYGTHAVAAALGNPSRRLRRLLVTEEAEATLAQSVGQPWPVAPERVERGKLDYILGRDIVHQGVALLADPLPIPALAQALERPGPVIVLDQVTDPRNVGAILRSAAAFGAAAVVAQERNAPEETGALAKAASGALETIPLLRAVNIARTVIALKAAGFWCVGLDAGGQPLSGPALAERRVALVLGAEGEGLRRLVRDTCDEVAGIAMPGGGGRLDSLNVSAAAAVALYELGKRA